MYTDPAQFPVGGVGSTPTTSPNSYVDEYTPPPVASTPTDPVTPVASADSTASTTNTTASAQAALDELEKLLAEIKAKNASLQSTSASPMTPPAVSDPVPSNPTMPVSTPTWEMPVTPTTSPTPTQPWEPTTPPAAPVAEETMLSSMDKTEQNSESLEDQNIFFLLGVTDGTDEQKESFLDELQQTIWEDFVDHDVKLLLTSEEYTEFEKEKASVGSSTPEAQEKLMTYLEAKIPDLEDILLEKALELKADMVRERIAGLREYHAGKNDALAKLDESDQLMSQGKWHSAATLLNSLPK